MKTYLAILFSLFMFLACTDHRQKADELIRQGKELEELQLPDSAIIIYQQAIRELRTTKNDTISGVLYNRIGDLMFENDLYPQAYEPYRNALAYNLRMNDKTEASKSIRGMGKSKLFEYANDSAVIYFKRALALSPHISNQKERSLIHNNLSLAYFELGKYDLSLSHITEALRLSQDSLNIYKNCNIKGDLFMQSKQYDSAYIYFKLGSKSKNIATQASSNYSLIAWARAINSKDSAQYIHIFRRLKDSIERESKMFQILRKDKQFQVTETQKEVKAKYLYWIIGIVMLFFILTFIFLKRSQSVKKKNKKLSGAVQKHRAEMSKLRHEQKVLISQKTKELNERRQKEEELKEHLFETVAIVKKIRTFDSLKPMQRSKCESEYILTTHELNQLEKAIDIRYDGFAKQLRAGFPKLT